VKTCIDYETEKCRLDATTEIIYSFLNGHFPVKLDLPIYVHFSSSIFRKRMKISSTGCFYGPDVDKDLRKRLPTPTAVMGVGFSAEFVCLCVRLHDVSKTNADRITKLDIEMLRYESWKPIYCGGEKVKVTSHK